MYSLKKLNRLLAGFVVVTFFATNTLTPSPLAHARGVEAPSFVSSFKIPDAVGRVHEIIPAAPQSPVLIHIQEAHANYDAQKNIRGILQYLSRDYGVDLVLMEGAGYKLEPKLFRFFPADAKLQHEANRKLMEAGELTGAEVFLMDAPRGAEGWGVEDAAAYRADREAFKAVFKGREIGNAFLDKAYLRWQGQAASVLNKGLREFLSRYVSYETGQSPLTDWLETLKKKASSSLDLDLLDASAQVAWPTLVRYFRLKKAGAGIDLAKSEIEKKKFFAETGLSSSVAGEVERVFASAKTGSLPVYETRFVFERMMDALPNDFSFAVYPNFRLHIQQLVLMSELQGEALQQEIRELSKQIVVATTGTESERGHVALLREYLLLKKLFHLELSREEYQQVVSRKIVPEHLAADVSPALQTLYQTALEFYAGAIRREDFMMEKSLARMKERKRTRAVLVTGGFHTDGLKERITRSGNAYIGITPRIGEVPADSRKNYLAALLGQELTGKSHMAPVVRSEIRFWQETSPRTWHRDFAAAGERVAGIVRQVSPEGVAAVRRNFIAAAASFRSGSKEVTTAVNAVGDRVDRLKASPPAAFLQDSKTRSGPDDADSSHRRSEARGDTPDVREIRTWGDAFAVIRWILKQEDLSAHLDMIFQLSLLLREKKKTLRLNHSRDYEQYPDDLVDQSGNLAAQIFAKTPKSLRRPVKELVLSLPYGAADTFFDLRSVLWGIAEDLDERLLRTKFAAEIRQTLHGASFSYGVLSKVQAYLEFLNTGDTGGLQRERLFLEERDRELRDELVAMTDGGRNKNEIYSQIRQLEQALVALFEGTSRPDLFERWLQTQTVKELPSLEKALQLVVEAYDQSSFERTRKIIAARRTVTEILESVNNPLLMHKLYVIDRSLGQMLSLSLGTFLKEWGETDADFQDALTLMAELTDELFDSGFITRYAAQWSDLLNDSELSYSQLLDVINVMQKGIQREFSRWISQYHLAGKFLYGEDHERHERAIALIRKEKFASVAAIDLLEQLKSRTQVQVNQNPDKPVNPEAHRNFIRQKEQDPFGEIAHIDDYRDSHYDYRQHERKTYGGKGTYLMRMNSLGLPVPSAFVIPSYVGRYRFYKQFPEQFQTAIKKHLRRLEEEWSGKKGHPVRYGMAPTPLLREDGEPLFLAVRSGAVFIMPGIFETAVAVGFTPEILEYVLETRGAKSGYRAFLGFVESMATSLGVPHDEFEALANRFLGDGKVLKWEDLRESDLSEMVREAYGIMDHYGVKEEFEALHQDVHKQLYFLIEKIFESWGNSKASRYRKEKNISDAWATPVIVQAYVFGDRDEHSGAGIATSHDPYSGDPVFGGEWVPFSQGMNHMQGRVPTRPIETMDSRVYESLKAGTSLLAAYFGVPQMVEFTVESRKPWFLQTVYDQRVGNTENFPLLDHEKISRTPEGHGNVAYGNEGALRGIVALKPSEVLRGDLVERMARQEKVEAVILVSAFPTPEDSPDLINANRILRAFGKRLILLTSQGGLTSHAAVVANYDKIPTVVSVQGLNVLRDGSVMFGGRALREGDLLTVDFGAGDVYAGSLPLMSRDPFDSRFGARDAANSNLRSEFRVGMKDENLSKEPGVSLGEFLKSGFSSGKLVTENVRSGIRRVMVQTISGHKLVLVIDGKGTVVANRDDLFEKLATLLPAGVTVTADPHDARNILFNGARIRWNDAGMLEDVLNQQMGARSEGRDFAGRRSVLRSVREKASLALTFAAVGLVAGAFLTTALVVAAGLAISGFFVSKRTVPVRKSEPKVTKIPNAALPAFDTRPSLEISPGLPSGEVLWSFSRKNFGEAQGSIAAFLEKQGVTREALLGTFVTFKPKARIAYTIMIDDNPARQGLWMVDSLSRQSGVRGIEDLEWLEISKQEETVSAVRRSELRDCLILASAMIFFVSVSAMIHRLVILPLRYRYQRLPGYILYREAIGRLDPAEAQDSQVLLALRHILGTSYLAPREIREKHYRERYRAWTRALAEATDASTIKRVLELLILGDIRDRVEGQVVYFTAEDLKYIPLMEEIVRILEAGDRNLGVSVRLDKENRRWDVRMREHRVHFEARPEVAAVLSTEIPGKTFPALKNVLVADGEPGISGFRQLVKELAPRAKVVSAWIDSYNREELWKNLDKGPFDLALVNFDVASKREEWKTWTRKALSTATGKVQTPIILLSSHPENPLIEDLIRDRLVSGVIETPKAVIVNGRGEAAYLLSARHAQALSDFLTRQGFRFSMRSETRKAEQELGLDETLVFGAGEFRLVMDSPCEGGAYVLLQSQNTNISVDGKMISREGDGFDLYAGTPLTVTRGKGEEPVRIFLKDVGGSKITIEIESPEGMLFTVLDQTYRPRKDRKGQTMRDRDMDRLSRWFRATGQDARSEVRETPDVLRIRSMLETENRAGDVLAMARKSLEGDGFAALTVSGLIKTWMKSEPAESPLYQSSAWLNEQMAPWSEKLDAVKTGRNDQLFIEAVLAAALVLERDRDPRAAENRIRNVYEQFAAKNISSEVSAMLALAFVFADGASIALRQQYALRYFRQFQRENYSPVESALATIHLLKTRIRAFEHGHRGIFGRFLNKRVSERIAALLTAAFYAQGREQFLTNDIFTGYTALLKEGYEDSQAAALTLIRTILGAWAMMKEKENIRALADRLTGLGDEFVRSEVREERPVRIMTRMWKKAPESAPGVFARSESRAWAKKPAELGKYTVVSRQLEAGLSRDILDRLIQKFGETIAGLVAATTVTGGLGALMHDLFPSWQKNFGRPKAKAYDAFTVNVIYDEIKGQRFAKDVPEEVKEGKRTLGDYLRDVLNEDPGLRLETFMEPGSEYRSGAEEWISRAEGIIADIDGRISGSGDANARAGLEAQKKDWTLYRKRLQQAREASDREIRIKVYPTETSVGGMPNFYVEAFYIDEYGAKVQIFDEVYPDAPYGGPNLWRDLQMAVYGRITELLTLKLQEKGLAKKKILFVDNEVFVSIPTPLLPDAIHHHMNHSVFEPTIYGPAAVSARLLGYAVSLWRYIVQKGKINVVKAIGMIFDMITGVALYEHTPAVAGGVAPGYVDIVDSYNGDGLRSTNGVLFEQWQSPLFRSLVDSYKRKLGMDEVDDRDFFAKLNDPARKAVLGEFQERFDVIKAYLTGRLMLWLKQSQNRPAWYDKAMEAYRRELGMESVDDAAVLGDLYRAIQVALVNENAWKDISGDAKIRVLRREFLKTAIVSNVRRQVSYKGPDKWREILYSLKADPAKLAWYKKHAARAILGGREFGQDAHDVFLEIQGLVKELGLEDKFATIENYNIEVAPILFQGDSATVMITYEVLEASATSMMKGLPNGAVLIMAWGGAGPELFTIVETATGREVDIFKEHVTYEQLVKNLHSKDWKITNGYLVEYSETGDRKFVLNTLDADGNIVEINARYPMAHSMIEALVNLQGRYQVPAERMNLEWEALRSSPLVDMEKSQARAHMKLWQKVIQKKERQQMIFAQSQLSPEQALRFLSQGEKDERAGFIWRTEKPEPLELAGPRVLDFIESSRLLRTHAAEGYRSVAYHAARGDIFGKIFFYLEPFRESLPMLYQEMVALKAQAESSANTLEKVRGNLAALRLLDLFVARLSEKILQGYLISRGEGYKELFRNALFRQNLYFYLESRGRKFGSLNQSLAGFAVEENGEKYIVALNLGEPKYPGVEGGEPKAWGQFYGEKVFEWLTGQTDPESKMAYEVSNVITGEIYGDGEDRKPYPFWALSRGALPIGVPEPDIQILRLRPTGEMALEGPQKQSQEMFIIDDLRALVSGDPKDQVRQQRSRGYWLKKTVIYLLRHDPENLKRRLKAISTLSRGKMVSELGFGSEGVRPVMAFIAGLIPEFLEDMRDWDPEVYHSLKAIMADPEMKDLFEKGDIFLNDASRDSAVVITRTVTERVDGTEQKRHVVIPIHFAKTPYNKEEGKVWFGLGSINRLGLLPGTVYKVRDWTANTVYEREHTLASLSREGWRVGVPVVKRKDPAGVQQSGWRFQVLQMIPVGINRPDAPVASGERPAAWSERSELRAVAQAAAKGMVTAAPAASFAVFFAGVLKYHARAELRNAAADEARVRKELEEVAASHPDEGVRKTAKLFLGHELVSGGRKGFEGLFRASRFLESLKPPVTVRAEARTSVKKAKGPSSAEKSRAALVTALEQKPDVELIRRYGAMNKRAIPEVVQDEIAAIVDRFETQFTLSKDDRAFLIVTIGEYAAAVEWAKKDEAAGETATLEKLYADSLVIKRGGREYPRDTEIGITVRGTKRVVRVSGRFIKENQDGIRTILEALVPPPAKTVQGMPPVISLKDLFGHNTERPLRPQEEIALALGVKLGLWKLEREGTGITVIPSVKTENESAAEAPLDGSAAPRAETRSTETRPQKIAGELRGLVTASGPVLTYKEFLLDHERLSGASERAMRAVTEKIMDGIVPLLAYSYEIKNIILENLAPVARVTAPVTVASWPEKFQSEFTVRMLRRSLGVKTLQANDALVLDPETAFKRGLVYVIRNVFGNIRTVVLTEDPADLGFLEKINARLRQANRPPILPAADLDEATRKLLDADRETGARGTSLNLKAMIFAGANNPQAALLAEQLKDNVVTIDQKMFRNFLNLAGLGVSQMVEQMQAEYLATARSA
ncbi:MAG TPA: PEP/pyruvate-binding domain-containing protein [Candidatus Omnitrophota bacterium]|nr:PEP/pyruvate-binding domain-containing protein [Candidatus Omnitrophota bacterium]